MYRKLSREEFKKTNLLVAKEERPPEFTWFVYDRYELVDREVGEGRYFRASKNAKVSREYEPFIDTPHLFLEFARLYERRSVDEAIRQWIDEFGLLGLHKESYEPRRVNFSVPEYSMRGDTRETLTRVQELAQNANRVLTLYEAALSRDVEKLEQALLLRGTRHTAQEHREYYRSEARSAGITYADVLTGEATDRVIGHVQEALEYFAYPCFGTLALSEGQASISWWMPEQLTSSWWPKNLLGAMYVQFFWLMTSFKDLSRCKHCGRVISYSPPISRSAKVRKPRKDKEFCDSRCRQNYHYHHRIKPVRKGRSA